jgi:hypothetical protein
MGAPAAAQKQQEKGCGAPITWAGNRDYLPR